MCFFINDLPFLSHPHDLTHSFGLEAESKISICKYGNTLHLSIPYLRHARLHMICHFFLLLIIYDARYFTQSIENIISNYPANFALAVYLEYHFLLPIPVLPELYRTLKTQSEFGDVHQSQLQV